MSATRGTVCRLLFVMSSEHRDRAADHVQVRADLGEAQPQLVVHAVVPVGAHAGASTLPHISREHHFGLVEELAGEPAMLDVEQVLQRQGSVGARGQVPMLQNTIAIDMAFARDHIGA